MRRGKAPPGSVVGLYVDLVAIVDEGDIIETQTGRRYYVLARREQARGKHAGRQHLRCLVLAEQDIPIHAGDTHRIRWYKR